ncbi:class D sortase [Paenibacillus abyssi]|uniref:Class D sortase n=1 Tax=Paenibacillus abyssi TaxID=1340531 RepID=A0A917G5D3_9BACL|nr:hypothetical protein GCM10010916_45710 [Paenibacillus abyssi]
MAAILLGGILIFYAVYHIGTTYALALKSREVITDHVVTVSNNVDAIDTYDSGDLKAYGQLPDTPDVVTADVEDPMGAKAAADPAVEAKEIPPSADNAQGTPERLPGIAAKNGVLYPNRPGQGDSLGTLYIPRLDVSLPIIHGTDPDELEKGVGHFAQSVLPGENDNSVLSGHRDTVFRKLGELEKNDLFTVKTSAGEFTYQVRSIKIVDADDRSVIIPTDSAMLTVTTCYPFNFIGSAPDRYILSSELVKSRTS